MNCYEHPNAPAVVKCAKCDVGLCRACLEGPHWEADNKPFCKRCSVGAITGKMAEIQAEITHVKASKGWAKTRLVISSILLVIALVMAQSNSDAVHVPILLFMAVGIVDAWRWWKYTDRKDNWLQRVIVAVLLGALSSPFTYLGTFFRIPKCNKNIQKLEDELKEHGAILADFQ